MFFPFYIISYKKIVRIIYIMDKLLLIKNPEFFQGKKYLNKNKSYFEGWYFKTIGNNNGISFIPGINIVNGKKHAFIQIITNKFSYYVKYNIDEFKFNYNPFYIKIGNNFFSKDETYIDIKDNFQNLIINGSIKYTNTKNINKSFISPNIMGFFSYIPFMECNHAVISMKSEANGLISINNDKIHFDKGLGYIEKDWGYSFPKSYIWCQGNNFKDSNASFMMSIANIPFLLFNFRGLICSLIIDDKEYRFATYNNTKIIEYEIYNDYLNITLKKGRYLLKLNCKYKKGLKLVAPVKGKMEKNIFESINEKITVTFKKDNKILFCDTSHNCGLEIVK